MILFYFRITITPKLNKIKTKNEVMKKFFFKSGYSSVSIAPFTSITGIIAFNKIYDENPSNPIIINLTINDVTGEMDNGVIKKITIRNNAIPMKMQENFVCSLYSTI
jgi:hypothetical protein